MITHVNDIDIAYDISGQGIPVLFLHAFPLNRNMWQSQAKELSRYCQVITVDYRGFGESQIVDETYFMELLAEDIYALCRYLSITKVVLAGLSMGGYVAFAFYRKYPQLVNALILADTRAEKDNTQAQRKRRKMARQAIDKGSAYIAEQMVPDLLGPKTLEQSEKVVKQVKEIITATEAKSIANAQYGMAARQDSAATLKSITRPVLLIAGAEDKLTPVALAEKMQAMIRNSELVIIPDAGHLSNLENPEVFNGAIKDFLNRI
jgi:pimeloyl-ACP methyl ester carboxylesterase